MLDFISTIAANRDSGRLNVVTGTTAGALLFNDGKLVDARLGNLTGFQAINALAAMPDVRYSFDPSVVPHEFSSITQSERVVLKQFFGIETVEPRADNEATVVVTGNTAHAELPAAPTYALTPRFSYARAFVMAAAVSAVREWLGARPGANFMGFHHPHRRSVRNGSGKKVLSAL